MIVRLVMVVRSLVEMAISRLADRPAAVKEQGLFRTLHHHLTPPITRSLPPRVELPPAALRCHTVPEVRSDGLIELRPKCTHTSNLVQWRRTQAAWCKSR